MSVSSDGILAFGIDLGEKVPEQWQEGFDAYLCGEAGLPTWRSGMTEGEKTDYWRKITEFTETTPVELVYHCSHDYPMYILAVRGTRIWASRGYPEEIHPKDLIVSQEKIDAFKEWCIEHKIEYTEPTWILCSMYG